MTTQKRILVFELNWLGDILFSFPFLRALRKRYPEAYIVCVVVPRYADLLEFNPWINDVHILSDNNTLSSLKEKLRFIKMIRREKYDTCFLMKPSRTKTLMSCFAGIRERIGFGGKNSPLTEVVDMPKGGFIHRSDQILALAGGVGVTEADGTYEYFFSKEDKQRADALIHQAGGGIRRIIALNPGGNWDAKRWPKEHFISLGKKLLDRVQDIELVVTGAGKDVDLAREIVSEIGSNRCYTVAGKTSVNELAVIFKRSVLVVSADSGPLHMASATGTATIGIFGPTSPLITGPRGRGENIVIFKPGDCEVPCYVSECSRGYTCMSSITPDEVFASAQEVLDREGGA